MRIGVVLSSDGGALSKMLLPFKMGVGGKVGSGKQYMSWIVLSDLVKIIDFCLKDSRASGPINAVAPDSVTNYTFTKTLGKVLHRPTIFPLPGFIVRVVFGEMGEELLLRGTRVVPQRLQELEFKYEYPQLEEALNALILK